MSSKKDSSKKKLNVQFAPIAKEISACCEELNLAESRLEEAFWQKKLQALIISQFEAGHDLEAFQKQLERSSPETADALFGEILAVSESLTATREGQERDCLLVAVPLLVSTRYVVPEVALTDADVNEISDALLECAVATQADIRLVPGLLGLAHTPDSYLDSWRCLNDLCDRSVDLRKLLPPGDDNLDMHTQLQADSRYVIFCLSVPHGQPMFRWQEDVTTSRAVCLDALRRRLDNTWRRLMPGCETQTLLPQLYRAALAQGEESIVPVIVQTTCRWLTDSLKLAKGALKASVAAVGRGDPMEYRIGYFTATSPDVIAGNIWPIIDTELVAEDPDNNAILNTLYKTLKDLGISDIKLFLEPVESPQYCGDCGIPFFPDATGELVHPDLPEQAQEGPKHLH